MQNWLFKLAMQMPKKTISPVLMLVVLVKKQTVETLKILVIFQMKKKTSVITDQNKNSSNHRRESTLTLLHAENTNIIYWAMFLLKLGSTVDQRFYA